MRSTIEGKFAGEPCLRRNAPSCMGYPAQQAKLFRLLPGYPRVHGETDN
jgi:hypothetical protein